MATRTAKNGNVRDRALIEVRHLARALDPEPAHAFQVRHNAAALFDATKSIHKMQTTDRRLLEAAALLHDIGHTIDVAGHHKHSRDLIMKQDLPGFSDREKQMVACVARYHRKAHPSPTHAVFADLKKSDRRRVEKLAAILRIADGLDRAHEASCKHITAEIEDGALVIHVEQRRPSPVDLWGAQRKQSLFEEVFGVRISIRPAAPPIPTKKAAS